MKYLFAIIATIQIIFLSTTRASDINVDYKTVAVVLAQNPDSINVPSVELYRQVKEAIGKSDNWIISPTWSVRMNLKNQDTEDEIPDLGSIPAFNRKELVDAHPFANMRNPDEEVKSSNELVIRSVQIMLDTLALEGAIIVDCLPNGTQVVDNCGLYYYDRSKGKVVSSSRKFFRAGVTDASNWSNNLIVALDRGMEQTREKRNRAELEKVLTFTEENESPMTSSMEMQIWGQRSSGSTVSSSVPGTTIFIYRENDSFSYGFGATYAQSSEKNGGDDLKFNEYGLTTSFAPRAYAGKSMVWELPIHIGVSQRNLTLDRSLDVDGEKKQLDAKLSIGPSLMWRMGRTTSFGLSAEYERYMGIEDESHNADDLALFDDAYKIGVRLKKSF